MNVVLSPETAKLLEEQMSAAATHRPTTPFAWRVQTLEQVEGEPLEELDPATLAAIERADAQAERGEGMPADEAFERLRRKHFGE